MDSERKGLTETLDVSSAERYCPSCDTSYSADAAHCPSDGTALIRIQAQVDTLLGRTVDSRFLVRERVGKGGMGSVYRALQVSTGREVALKVIDPALSGDPMTVKRFLRECKLASQLNHPGSVTVLDFGQDPEGLLFLVMELLAGQTLRDAMRTAPITLPRFVEIAKQLCACLSVAHAQGIIHRDLKPANIMLSESAGLRVQILDFGLAKSLAGDDSTMTLSNMMLGTPSYMPPEGIAGGAKIDARGDLYSLGVIFYEMVAGRLPFAAENITEMLSKHATESPQALSKTVQPALRMLIESMLKKRPEDRPQTAAQIALALDRVDTSLSPGVDIATIDTQKQVAPDDEAIRSGAARAAASGSLRSPRDGTSPVGYRALAALPVQSSLMRGPSVGDVRAARPRPSRLGLVVALGVLAAAGIVAAIVLLQGGNGDTGGEAQAVASPATEVLVGQDASVSVLATLELDAAAAPGIESESEAVPEGALVDIRFETTPLGARARVSDKRCTTPCEMRLKMRSSYTVEFSRDGHKPKRVRFMVVESGQHVEATLIEGRRERSSGGGEETKPKPGEETKPKPVVETKPKPVETKPKPNESGDGADFIGLPKD